MKLLIFLLAGLVAWWLLRPRVGIKAVDAAKRVADGDAVLIDVREPDEWIGGVAAPAKLLPLSDLRGDRRRWQPLLEEHRGKELILYCRSGVRSAMAVSLLVKDGYRAVNLGGFSAWRRAGLPERQP